MMMGQKAPDFLTSAIYGKNFALKDHLGQQGGNKVLILAFFNTGCKVSQEDLRYLRRVYDLYKDNGLDGICLFTGQSATNRDQAKRFIQNLDLKLPVVQDEKNSWKNSKGELTGPPKGFEEPTS